MVATRSRDYDTNPVLQSPHTIVPHGGHNRFLNHDVVAVALLSISISILSAVLLTNLMM